ncbi:histidine kinase [Helicobacter sp. faydin-H20]|uniref:histidine kinase n=1 Tax=Helicobacter anatolicus TaxID=2905874 RepID=UPI001E589ABB|nr:histidine kinase [Helicobacter anatolicus]MCE3037006.1 histidine kinase [Helicobacter anatolicus]
MSNNNPKKRILIRKGFELFETKQYKQSMQCFSDALYLDEEDLEAKIGLFLTDMAVEFPNEAHGFYDLYQTMIGTNPRSFRKKVQQSILEGIKSFDNGIDKIAAVFFDDQKDLKVEEIDGILYKDFKQMCKEKNFKEVFENLLFSSKIIFTKKEDFYSFLNDLLDNNLSEYCLQYIESMKKVVFFDSELDKILKKLVERL